MSSNAYTASIISSEMCFKKKQKLTRSVLGHENKIVDCALFKHAFHAIANLKLLFILF